ncbi:MAG: hypothetical protein VKM92_04560 [Cyanobacteriota bacterium]|nr:hypothetical protein [Cyanobacteriota bacterium]
MTIISEVSKQHTDGSVDYHARIYLGPNSNDKILYITCKSDEFIPRKWRQDQIDNRSIWDFYLHHIRPGTGLSFRLELIDGRSIPFVPLGESDVVNGVVRVPDYEPSWLNANGTKLNSLEELHNSGMAILLEHTLEGLLATYEDGAFFTDAIEELLDWSIADRILQTRIPEEIRDLGYNEIMFPLYASVADRCNLDPKFNYLVYNISTDWQLGTAKDLRKLVHRFRSCGIELVPDLVFVHQVSNPYDGSSDDIGDRVNGLQPYQDQNAFYFRDYGTWHFDLKDPIIREILIDKILETISILDLRVMRVDYIDGLLMQYLNQAVNYGAIMLQELKMRLKRERPHLRIIGEAFQTASDPSVRGLIDSAYAPRGFALLDLLLAPGCDRTRVIGDTVIGLTEVIHAVNQQGQDESNYSQLHDECWQDEWIRLGRPHTPWAYGAMPLSLCLARIDELIAAEWLQSEQRYPKAVALVLLLRNLGLTLSFRRWMETTGCLSLDEGRLDDKDHWKFPWDSSTPLAHAMFRAEGLNEAKRRRLVEISRSNVAAFNHLIRLVGPSESSPLGVPLNLVHGDINNGLSGFVRWGRRYPNPALVLANLSPVEAGAGQTYEIDLQSAGWPSHQHPPVLKSLLEPVSMEDIEPLILTQSREEPNRYRLSRGLHGFETALFEVRIHGS